MTWDIALRKLLQHDGARFEIDVRFASACQRLVLYGPSGAGKTQTLRMIAGIVRPDGGRVTIGARALYDGASGLFLTPQQRRLAYVFQDYALFPHLTVRQNIAFAQHTGWTNPARDARDAGTRRWIAAFHLEAVAGLYPHQLSGGQRQRTALARALVCDPVALLLDEPFAALDAPLRRRLRDELRDLQAQLALPMLLITHDDDDVHVLADEVVTMDSGRVVGGAAPAAQAREPGEQDEQSEPLRIQGS
jgi:molybdate transport system ATP-binding protein